MINTVATAFNLQQINSNSKYQNITQQQLGRSLLLAAQAQLLSQQNAAVTDTITNANSLSYIIPRAEYLTTGDVLQTESLSSQVLRQALASSASLSANDVVNALIPLNAVLEYVSNITTAISFSQVTVFIGDSVSGINLFLQLLQVQSLPGAPAVSYVLSQFRLASVCYSYYNAENSSNSFTLQAPQSQSSIILMLTNNYSNVSSYGSIALATVQLVEYTSPNTKGTQLYSSILTAKISSSSTFSSSSVMFALPYIVDEITNHTQQQADTTQVICLPYMTGRSYVYTCPRNISVKVDYTCPSNSSFSKLFVSCPYHSLNCCQVNVSSQSLINNSSSSSAATCTSLNVTNGILYCRCINIDSSSTQRKLTTSTAASANFVSTSALTVAAITKYVGENFQATLTTSTRFDSYKTLTRSLIVIIMFCSLWGSGIFVVGLLYYKQGYYFSASVKLQEVNKIQKLMKKTAASAMEPLLCHVLMRYCRTVIPKVFDSTPFFLRLRDELLRHHVYLSALFGQKSHRSPALGMLEVLTIQTTLMFLMALLYDLQAPDDDGSCSSYITEVSCLQRRSILDHKVTYCTWTLAASHVQVGDDDISSYYSCNYHEPVFSFTVALYCAVVISLFTALFMRPLDYCFLLLSASLETNNVITRRPLFSVPILPFMHKKVQVASRLVSTVARKASTFISRPLHHLISTRFIPQETIMSHKAVLRIMNNINDNNSNDVVDLSQLITAMIETEEKDSRVNNFSKILNYDNMIAHLQMQLTQQYDLLPAGEEREKIWNSWQPVLTGEYHDLETKKMLVNKIQDIDRTAEKVVQTVMNRSDEEAGLEIMRMFLMDLLGGDNLATGQIFNTKFNLDYTTLPQTTARTKICLSCMIVGMNAFFIYYTLLKGYRRGIGWQHCYLIACITQLLAEILLFETIVCLWLHFFVPGLVYYEVKRVKRQIAHALHETAKIICRNQQQHLDGTSVPKSSTFNTAEYFFVSNKVARLFPRPLVESMIVLSYQTYLPGSLLTSTASSTSSASSLKRAYLTAWNIQSVVVLMALLPTELQQSLIRFFEPFLFGSLFVAYELISHDRIAWISILVIFSLLLTFSIFLLLKAWNYRNKEVVEEIVVRNSSALLQLSQRRHRSVRKFTVHRRQGKIVRPTSHRRTIRRTRLRGTTIASELHGAKRKDANTLNTTSVPSTLLRVSRQSTLLFPSMYYSNVTNSKQQKEENAAEKEDDMLPSENGNMESTRAVDRVNNLSTVSLGGDIRNSAISVNANEQEGIIDEDYDSYSDDDDDDLDDFSEWSMGSSSNEEDQQASGDKGKRKSSQSSVMNDLV